MAMKKIPPHEQALISASVYLNSFQRAIEELVYNSLDAESTSIAIRVFIQENFIQVLDNGVGITKKDFKLLGKKYATSKYVDNNTLKSAPNKYGFRGMSLASIIEISETVKISSKYQEETWMKKFCNGKAETICITTTRPSKGTTVEILGFLYNLNIQKKSIDALKELHNIKLGLEQLSLIHCNVSISLRDDSKNEVVFRINKNRDMYQTLESLFSIQHKDFQDLQVEKNKYKIKALIGIHKEDTKKYQWIYLNAKIVLKTKLHKKLNACLNKVITNKTKRNVKNKDKFPDENNLFNSNIPFYFVFVSCPNYDFDIIYKSKETFVEFKNWKEIDKLIDKLAKFYYSSISVHPINFNPDLKQKESKCHRIDTRQKVKEIMEKILNNNTNKHKISQLQKGVKGNNIKRKKKRNTETALSKIKDNKHMNNKAKLFKQAINLRINDPKNENTRNKSDSRETQVNLQLASENFRKKSKLNNKTNNLKTNNPAQSRVKKQSALQNSLIKKFCNQSETVKKRCKQLAYKAAQKLLNNKMKREYSKKLEYKNVIDKKSSFKETYEFTPKNPIHRKSYVHNIDNHIFKNDINKIECKTTYDLIRPANEFLTPLPKTSNDNITIERYNVNKSYFNSYESIAPITTFNSHNYENQKHINIQKRNGIKHFMTTDSRKNFLLRGQIFNPTRNEILNKARKNNKQNKINDKIMNLLSESVEISTYPSNIHKNENTYNNIVAQDNDNFNIAYDTATDVKYYSKDDMEDVYSTYNVNYANTYTINVFTESILSNNQHNKTYSLQMYSKRYDNEINYSSSLFTRNETLLNDNNVDRNDFFISEAKNSTLEPLNFCETVLHEEDMRESEIVNNFNKCDVEENIVNGYGIPQSLKEHSKNNDNYYDKDTDFNSPNIDVNLNINNKINSPVNDYVKEDDIVANQNFGNILQDLTEEKDFNILNDQQNFELKPRHSFLPKGMSPIFKDNLQKISYDYDLELDYYDREIYKNFAEDVLANHEIFEPEVVNIKDTDTRNIKNVNNKLSKEYSDLIFDSSSLKHVKVLGQVDQKFIACIIHGNSSKEDRYSDFLALFDQHAVDERVRLENNLKDYFDGNEWKSVPIDSAIKINLSEENYLYFHNNKEKFYAFGLQWTVNDNEVLIHAIPKAILGKNIREVEIVMKAVKTLVSEQIDAIKSLGGNVSSYPKSIMDLVFSEACRYAIKFGDKLYNNDCVEMINKLSSCKTPFQCAHGRPVMAILMELTNTNTSYKINLNKIQEFKVHHNK